MPDTPPQTGALLCDLLVFDLDGTLIDSQKDLANAVNATLAFLHRPHLDDRQIAAFIGDGAAKLVHRALGATGVADDSHLAQAMPFFLGYYREHKLDFTRAYPGVMHALRQIRAAAPHLPMAVLTNKPVRPSHEICDGLGLSEFFFANYGGDSFEQKKPAPNGMRALMEEATELLGRPVMPQRTVLVGDSHVDVETARAAGTKCIGCTYGLDADGLRAAVPDTLVNHASEWLDALHRVLD